MFTFFLCGSIVLTAWSVVSFFLLRKPIRDFLYRRAYRRESRYHPGQFCNDCGAMATKLVQQGSYPHKTVWICKDHKTCRKTVAYEHAIRAM